MCPQWLPTKVLGSSCPRAFSPGCVWGGVLCSTLLASAPPHARVSAGKKSRQLLADDSSSDDDEEQQQQQQKGRVGKAPPAKKARSCQAAAADEASEPKQPAPALAKTAASGNGAKGGAAAAGAGTKRKAAGKGGSKGGSAVQEVGEPEGEAVEGGDEADAAEAAPAAAAAPKFGSVKVREGEPGAGGAAVGQRLLWLMLALRPVTWQRQLCECWAEGGKHALTSPPHVRPRRHQAPPQGHALALHGRRRGDHGCAAMARWWGVGWGEVAALPLLCMKIPQSCLHALSLPPLQRWWRSRTTTMRAAPRPCPLPSSSSSRRQRPPSRCGGDACLQRPGALHEASTPISHLPLPPSLAARSVPTGCSPCSQAQACCTQAGGHSGYAPPPLLPSCLRLALALGHPRSGMVTLLQLTQPPPLPPAQLQVAAEARRAPRRRPQRRRAPATSCPSLQRSDAGTVSEAGGHAAML